ncbi:chemotaxis protein CheW [Sulfuriferula plumbiphila]|uniref:Chemotaxis protein CheW n=1 Tax=Sulfuriferula plumbiphila TaxID=171865 RepID=A0A512L6N9_9PROT|nr:chemotaxis protein CheW [Sulfuriferula plumbiphila]BBP04875.1 chemotaxis protein CheW [Sulfuriferula plumbiphila]GEP30148.1 chemotaxis protein CheW [Sulfuriferula plumbiphila]
MNVEPMAVMGKPDQLLVFALGDQRCALYLSAVDRVVRMVEITPLPKAPAIVSGVVNVHGEVIPVINLRKRFDLPQRDIALTDQLVIAHTARRPVALVVDTVTDIVECAGRELVVAESILPELEYVQGVAKLKDGLILIYNLEQFLSLEEEESLDQAMAPL